MADFRDPTPIDPNKDYQITELAEFIRTKMDGHDVREALALGLERAYEDAATSGNANMEVAQARGSYPTLARRLLELDEIDQEVTARLAQTMTQTEFDSWVATLLDGGPSIFMDTYAELQDTYPSGTSGVALVRETDPARIYVWNGTAWEDFGDYQGVEIKDETVRPNKTVYKDDSLKETSAWAFGSIDTSDNYADLNNRIYSSFLPVFKNTVIKVTDGFQVLVHEYDSDGQMMEPNSFKQEVTVGNAHFVRLVARYTDNRVIDDANISDIIANINIYNTLDKNVYLSPKKIASAINLELPEFVLGVVDIAGNVSPSTTRVRTQNRIKATRGQFLSLSTNELEMFAVEFGQDDSVVGYSRWGHIYKVKEDDSTLSINIRFRDEREITTNDFAYIMHTIDLPIYQTPSLEERDNRLVDKKLLNLGDSIASSAADGVIGYDELIAQKNKMELTSRASGGATITVQSEDPNNIVKQVDEVVDGGYMPDYILFEGGTNDAHLATSTFGDISVGYEAELDVSTFCGAFEYCLKTLRLNFMSSKIIYVRAHNMASRDERQITLGELAIQMCKKWSIPYVDLYNEGGLNTQISEMIGVYTLNESDRTHPNSLGYELFYAPQIEAKMKSI